MCLKKSLLVCSSKKELYRIKTYDIHNYCIGTRNYSFFRECQQEKEQVTFLDIEKGMPYEKVRDIIGKINAIIETCVKKEYLYTFSNLCEGRLAGHIAEILLFIDYFKKLFEEIDITEVYTIDNKENWVINEAIFLIMQNQQEKLWILDENTGERKKCLVTLRDSYYDTEKKKKSLKQKLQLDCFFEYWKRPRKKHVSSNAEFEIGILYAGNNIVRLAEWTLASMMPFLKYFSVNIVSLYRFGENDKFLEKEANVDFLEDYFNKLRFVFDVIDYWRSVIRIRKELEHHCNVSYSGIDMKYYLCKKAMNWIKRENPERTYLDNCMREYARCRKHKLMYAWPILTFGFENRMAYHYTREENTKFFCWNENLVFYFPYYEKHANEIEIRIFPNESVQKSWMKYFEFEGRVYYAPDEFVRHSLYKKIPKKMMGDMITMLFAPAEPVTGFLSLEKYLKTCEEILSTLVEENCEIIVKNHPNIDVDIENVIKKKYISAQNIKFVSKDISFSRAVEKCDIVIASSASLAFFDAVMAQRPAFGMRWYEYVKMNATMEEGFLVYNDTEKLCNDILEVVSDLKCAKEKLDSIVYKQNLYMEKLRGNMPGNYAENIKRIIEKELEKN